MAPLDLPGDDEGKRLVVIGHEAGCAVCIKATSQMGFLKKRRDVAEGCILVRGGELAFFPKDTYIEPHNQFRVPYAKLQNPNCVKGRMPQAFHGELLEKIKISIMLGPQDCHELRQLMGDGT